MGFIMPACAKFNWRWALLALLFASAAAVADFKVADVQPKLADRWLTLSGTLDLNLSGKVEEALSKGIPIEIVIEIRLNRQRRFMWDQNIADWARQRRIQYHDLNWNAFRQSLFDFAA